MIDRRAFLAGAGATSSTGLLPGCASIPRISVQLGFAAIDIHSHFFNGSDLPVADFLRQVVLKDHSNRLKFTGAILKLFTDVLLFRVPTAKDELKDLPRGAGIEKRIQKSSSPAAPGQVALRAGLEKQANQIRQQQRRAADRLNRKGLRTQNRAAPAFTPEEDLLAQIEGSVGLAPRGTSISKSTRESARIMPLQAPKRRARVQQIIGRIYRRTSADEYQYTGAIPTALRWVALLTENRNLIIDEYVRLYLFNSNKSKTPRGLVASSPSIVDFSHWLGPATRTNRDSVVRSSLRSQVDVMSRLARIRPDIALIPFVPFDPLREAVGKIKGRSPSLDLVKYAVMEKGFAGVKLYPPMGFRPIGNERAEADNVYAERVYQAALARAGVPQSKSAGKALDDELRILYDWAKDNNVPIKAHANNSIEAQKDSGAKASPEYWGEVLLDFPDLKVNLAHFGGFEEERPCNRTDCDQPTTAWEDLIGEIINSTGNLYFDTGYWMELISDRRAGRTAIRKRTEKFFSDYPKAVSQMMFGTDWSMTAKDPGHETYLKTMNDTIVTLFPNNPAAQGQYFGGNAINFLGLRKNGFLSRDRQTTRTRFEAYYGDHKPYRHLFDIVDDGGET